MTTQIQYQKFRAKMWYCVHFHNVKNQIYGITNNFKSTGQNTFSHEQTIACVFKVMLWAFQGKKFTNSIKGVIKWIVYFKTINCLFAVPSIHSLILLWTSQCHSYEHFGHDHWIQDSAAADS